MGLVGETENKPASEMIAAKTTPASNKWRLRPRERQTLLLLGDFIMAEIALVIAIYVWSVADLYQGFTLGFISRLPQLYGFQQSDIPVGTGSNCTAEITYRFIV